MPPTVYLNDKVKSVKNLGWLLRHWRDVSCFKVTTKNDGSAYLVAYLHSIENRYETDFASKVVLRDFLDRPVFQGVTTEWNGQIIMIGHAAWRMFAV